MKSYISKKIRKSIFVLIIACCTLPLFSKSINILELFTITFPANFNEDKSNKLTDIKEGLLFDNSKNYYQSQEDTYYYIRASIQGEFKEESVFIELFFKFKSSSIINDKIQYFYFPTMYTKKSFDDKVLNKIKNVYDKERLANYYHIGKEWVDLKNNLNEKEVTELKKILYNNGLIAPRKSYAMGQGSIHSMVNNMENDITYLTLSNGQKIRKYITPFPNDVFWDILAYNFTIDNHPIFEECLIQVINIKADIPDKLLTTTEINKLIAKNDERVEVYKLLDEIIKSIEFTYEPVFFYLTPTINNLRFRATPTLDGRFIRHLKAGEQLEFIERGKSETIGDVAGTWVKVKTAQGEVGWCFDAYLKEVK